MRQLQQLRDDFTDCVGCGCLSIDRCKLANPYDELGKHGPGPRRLLEQNRDDVPGHIPRRCVDDRGPRHHGNPSARASAVFTLRSVRGLTDPRCVPFAISSS